MAGENCAFGSEPRQHPYPGCEPFFGWISHMADRMECAIWKPDREELLSAIDAGAFVNGTMWTRSGLEVAIEASVCKCNRTPVERDNHLLQTKMSDLVQLLISKGARVDDATRDHRSMLVYAIQCRQFGIATILLEAKAALHTGALRCFQFGKRVVCNDSHISALLAACNEPSTPFEFIQKLVEAGADVNYACPGMRGLRAGKSGSVLEACAENHGHPVVHYLIENGAKMISSDGTYIFQGCSKWENVIALQAHHHSVVHICLNSCVRVDDCRMAARFDRNTRIELSGWDVNPLLAAAAMRLPSKIKTALRRTRWDREHIEQCIAFARMTVIWEEGVTLPRRLFEEKCSNEVQQILRDALKQWHPDRFYLYPLQFRCNIMAFLLVNNRLLKCKKPSLPKELLFNVFSFLPVWTDRRACVQKMP
jgi:hypothetical protein